MTTTAAYQLSDANGHGAVSGRPAPGIDGREWLDDTLEPNVLYRDDGAAWRQVSLSDLILDGQGHVVISYLPIAGPAQLGVIRNSLFDVQAYNTSPGAARAQTMSAFASAYAAAVAAGGGTIYLGRGTWYVNQLKLQNDNIHLLGAGREHTLIVQNAVIDSVNGDPVVYIQSCNNCSVRDLTIVGLGAGTPTTYVDGAGLWLARGANHVIENVTIKDAAHVGAYMYRTSDSHVRGLTIKNTHATTPDGLQDGEGMFIFTACYRNILSSIEIDTCDGHGLTIDAGTSITLSDAEPPADNVVTGLVIHNCGQGNVLGTGIKLKGCKRNVIDGFVINGTGFGVSEAIGFYENQNSVPATHNLVVNGVVSNIATAIVNFQGASRNTVKNIEAVNIGNCPSLSSLWAIVVQGGNQNAPDPYTNAYPTIELTQNNKVEGVRLAQDPPGPFVGSSPATRDPGPQTAPTFALSTMAGSTLDTGFVYYAVAYLVDGRETAVSPLSLGISVSVGQGATVNLPLGTPETTSNGVAASARVLYRCHDGLTSSLKYVARINDDSTLSYVDTVAFASLTGAVRKYNYAVYLSGNCTVNELSGATLKSPQNLVLSSGSATGGALTNGAQYLVTVTSLDSAGRETLPCADLRITATAGGTGTSASALVSWTNPTGSTATTGHNLYITTANQTSPRTQTIKVNASPIATTSPGGTVSYNITSAGAPGVFPWTRLYGNSFINCDLGSPDTGVYLLYPALGPLTPPLSGAHANIIGGSLPVLSNPVAPQVGNANLDGSISVSGRVLAGTGVLTPSLSTSFSGTNPPVISGSPANAAPDQTPIWGGGVSGNYLFLPCTLANTVNVYDLSATTPSKLGNTISTGGGTGPNAAVVYATKLLVPLAGSNQIKVYDITTPTGTLTLLGTTATGNGTVPRHVVTFGTTMAVSLYGTNQVAFYDISALPTATLLSTVTVGAHPYGLATWTSSGGDTYVAACNSTANTLSIIKATTTASAAVVSTVTLPSYFPFWATAYAPPGRSSLLVTMQSAGGPVALDVTDATAPVYQGRAQIDGVGEGQPYLHAASLTALVPVSDTGKVEIINLNSSPPIRLSSLSVSGDPVAIYSQGSRVFVVAETAGTMQAYSLPPTNADALTIGGKNITLADGTNFPTLVTNAGTPGGTPATGTMVYDTSAHKLWVYDAGWKSTTLA